MESKKIYIRSAHQISLQQPLSESWMENPQIVCEPYSRSVDPNFREWLNPLESRRLGKILKRALVTSMKVMSESGIASPDAIITGTGLGCIENTEIFLGELSTQGEEVLKPTIFMQSTHNTISSLIAINTKCHGYNSTYSHKSVSFDQALLDAFLQLSLGDISCAMVTGNDELTPTYFEILKRAGYVGKLGQVPASEASAALMLTGQEEGSLCSLENVELFYDGAGSDEYYKRIRERILERIAEEKDVAVLEGVNGVAENDGVYEKILEGAGVPRLKYKHIFGECYTVSGLGVYAAAHILAKGEAPGFLRCDGIAEPLKVKKIVFVNHSDGKDVSLVCMNALK